ncbi:MAG: hypothetical protein Q4G25_02420 [Paracoccus sp. (in: a-proteobacteria)]|nr:hypothetical protein [Paracoccus sp. (in: a-proteobacteria)]
MANLDDHKDTDGASGIIPVNTRELARLNMTGMPPNWGWLYGDMCLYLARAALPDCQRFLMVENDVLFTGDAAARLLQLVNGTDAAAMAVRLALHEEMPKHSRRLAALGCDPHAGCIFPVVYATADTIDRMAVLRRAALADRLLRLNDEAILSGVVFRDALPCISLDQAEPSLFSPASFETNPPHLRESVLRETTAAAWHPTHSLQDVLARIADPARSYGPYRLRQILAGALPEEHAAIRAALRQARATKPT